MKYLVYLFSPILIIGCENHIAEQATPESNNNKNHFSATKESELYAMPIEDWTSQCLLRHKQLLATL